MGHSASSHLRAIALDSLKYVSTPSRSSREAYTTPLLFCATCSHSGQQVGRPRNTKLLYKYIFQESKVNMFSFFHIINSLRLETLEKPFETTRLSFENLDYIRLSCEIHPWILNISGVKRPTNSESFKEIGCC